MIQTISKVRSSSKFFFTELACCVSFSLCVELPDICFQPFFLLVLHVQILNSIIMVKDVVVKFKIFNQPSM